MTSRYRRGFYYEQLDIDAQLEYRRIAAAVSAYKSEIRIPYAIHDANKVCMAIKYDNPELFYWAADGSKLNGDVLELSYATDRKEDAEDALKCVRDKRNEILETLLSSEFDRYFNPVDIVEKVYSYMTKNIDYAEDELQKPDCAPWIYDIRGPLLRNRGVCLGIAQTLNYFCQTLHIPSILVTGEAAVAGWRGNHGWNLIELDSHYYHFDVTSEICENDSGEPGRFYMLKDAELRDRHWSQSVYPRTI